MAQFVEALICIPSPFPFTAAFSLGGKQNPPEDLSPKAPETMPGVLRGSRAEMWLLEARKKRCDDLGM